MANLPVKTSRDGVVTLGDLGEARRTFKDATSLARFNGRPAITIEVIKRVGTNTVETAEAAKWMTQQSAALWPETVRYEYLGDTSVYVSDFLETLRNSVLSAVALVAIVVVAALGWRSALLVGVSIPGAFLFGILILYALGNSINTVVLFGLILAVGLLVDGAIVVSEYADRKLLEGASKRDAFRLAAQRMAWPITASTATTLMAFAPLLFWPGIIGDFMSYLPLTLIFTLIGSLLMALIFLPTLGAAIGKPGEGNAELMEHLAGDKGDDPKNLGGFTGAYAQFLSRVMHHPGKILSLTLLALVGTWTLFITDNSGQILFPDGEPNSARLLVHARGNLSVNEMSRIVSNVESKVLDVEGVENRYTRIGAGSGDADDIIGRITLLFKDWNERRPATEIEAEIRQRVADIPGVKIEFSEEQQGPVQGKAIQIEIASDHSSLLTAAVDKIRRHLDQMEGWWIRKTAAQRLGSNGGLMLIDQKPGGSARISPAWAASSSLSPMARWWAAIARMGPMTKWISGCVSPVMNAAFWPLIACASQPNSAVFRSAILWSGQRGPKPAISNGSTGKTC